MQNGCQGMAGLLKFRGLLDSVRWSSGSYSKDKKGLKKKKLIDIGLRGFHRILKKFLDGYYQDIGWFVRLLIPVNQLESKVAVDNYVDKSRIARFFL